MMSMAVAASRLSHFPLVSSPALVMGPATASISANNPGEVYSRNCLKPLVVVGNSGNSQSIDFDPAETGHETAPTVRPALCATSQIVGTWISLAYQNQRGSIAR